MFALNKPKMKPVQKVVYHLMKESELRKKLKDEGLDTKGDKKTLIQRHQRFAVLWNAQCQSVRRLRAEKKLTYHMN